MQVLHQPPFAFLQGLGISVPEFADVHYQLSPRELVRQTLQQGEGELTDSGALAINTGKFTGRSPKDRFIVDDDKTNGSIDWNEINQPFTPENFAKIYDRMLRYFRKKELWVRDAYACDDPRYRLPLRIITEKPWASLFCYNMLLRPGGRELEHFIPEWTLLHAPGCKADPATDGTRQGNFAVINFTRKMILIGGTAYTGEIKKGIFSVLNYLLPREHGVLSMHCSANVGKANDTALFFGLSGTGKTTLSADADRRLIGDDEHGWSPDSVFNFEGGCYAKCINLCEEKEPQIYHAIREGALLENVRFFEGSSEVDYADGSITENTRVSYPIHYLENISQPSSGGIPKNIFLLTCDAYGVLPPLAKLTPFQAMYQFISGYTAKIAGTETGIDEPKATFSACFGAPFLPLHPASYAHMLGEKMRAHRVNCWLVNTGWTGGPYGAGKRIKLPYTRRMVKAVLAGELENIHCEVDPVFGLAIPDACPGIPNVLLHPRDTWSDKKAYDQQAGQLGRMFVANFEKFSGEASAEVLSAA
ncbi:MAG TPA: phosphoenolpyruvate carboxykinase (ATP), partial [Chitinophagaceae bacterium]|nr:phosphoenolpyruvate carboxykinase (ATP) [Chitinophagaceae bacterium]